MNKDNGEKTSPLRLQSLTKVYIHECPRAWFLSQAYRLHSSNQLWLLPLLVCWPLHAQGVYVELFGGKDKLPQPDKVGNLKAVGSSTILPALPCPALPCPGDSMDRGPLGSSCFRPPRSSHTHTRSITLKFVSSSLADWLSAAYMIKFEILCITSEPSVIWSHPTLRGGR